MTMTIIKNLDANVFDIGQTIRVLDELRRTTIDSQTGFSVWRKPNPNTWEKLYLVIPKRTIVRYSSEDLIPDSMKSDKALYFLVPDFGKEKIVIHTPDTIIISWCRFGTSEKLKELIIKNLKKSGIPELSITESNNDILLNGKKICGVLSYRRAGFIIEMAMVTVYYDDKLFKELLLPEHYYNKGNLDENDTGITGIQNDFPNVDRLTLLVDISSDIVYKREPYVDIEDTGIMGGQITLPSEEDLNKLFQEEKNRKKKEAYIQLQNTTYILEREEKVRLYRSLKELGKKTNITEEEYRNVLIELEAAREYLLQLYDKIQNVENSYILKNMNIDVYKQSSEQTINDFKSKYGLM